MTSAEPQINLLGRFLVLRGGEEVPAAAFGGRKVRQLVRVLAIRHGSYASHDALTDALWPQRPPADPAANLGVLVNRARRALGDPALIATAPRGYLLTGRCSIDAESFEQALDAARQARVAGDSRRALHGFRTALAGWAGTPLPEDVDAEWAREYRHRLLRMHQAALEEAAELAIELQETTLAIGFADAAVAAEPLREIAYLTLARALATSGDQASALSVLRDLRRTFNAELGLDPSPEAAALQERLLRGRPTSGRRTGATSSTSISSIGSARSAEARTRANPPTAIELPFVGRDGELDRLLAAVTGPRPDGAVITGTAGAGKSRLLAELSARLTMPVLSARAVEPEQSEAWSLSRALLREALAMDSAVVRAVPRRALQALADVVPDLADLIEPELIELQLPETLLDPQTRRALVLEAGLRLLLAALSGGAVLVVDDLQWADPSSLAMVSALLGRATGLGFVLAYRPQDDAPADGDVRKLLAGLAQRPFTAITLAALSIQDVAQLVGPDVAPAVRRSTDGMPFAVTEVIQGLVQRQELIPDLHGGWRPCASTAAQVAAQLGRAGRERRLHARLLSHDRDAREVLGLLALLARPVPAQTLTAAAGLPHARCLAVLTELARSGLVRLGDRGWATAHDLVRETITAELPAAERGRLHGLLAAALSQAGADPAELAVHHAGAGDPDAAARCYGRAARALLTGFADAEAGDLAETGLALADREVRQDLLEVRAEVRARRGDLPGARSDLREALAAGGPGVLRSRLLGRLAMLFSGSEDLVRAAALAESALLEAGTDPAARARALEVAAIIDMNLELPDRARERSGTALAVYQEIGDAQGAARIMDSRAMATFLDGDIRAAIELFRQVADLFTDSGDLLRVITPQSTLGHALVFGADPAAGLEQTGAALDLARSLGNSEGQTYALWHRSEALAALGRADEAVSNAREGLAIAERIGHRGWTATSWRALGIALTCGDDLAGAEQAFRRSLDCSNRLSLFASWAASRLAMVLITIGRLDQAAPLVQQALSEGPELAGYEARLAGVELAAAREDPDLPAMASTALQLSRDGGHLACLPRLLALTSGG